MLNLLMEQLGSDGSNYSLVQYHFENNTFGKSEKNEEKLTFQLYCKLTEIYYVQPKNNSTLCPDRIQFETNLQYIYFRKEIQAW